MTVVLLCAGWTPDDIDRRKLAKVQSAYLLNFIKFTKWPDSAFASDDGPIRLVVLGPDELGSVLGKTVRKKPVRGRDVEVIRIAVPTPREYPDRGAFDRAFEACVAQAASAHLLYIPDTSVSGQRSVLTELPPHVLTVGLGRESVRDYTMLALELEAGKVVFHANAKRIKASDLKVSSKLLKLARPIGKGAKR